MARTVAVYQGKRTRPSKGKGDKARFLIWKLVNKSGIGFEEIHYTTLDGEITDPGEYSEEACDFSVEVTEVDHHYHEPPPHDRG